MQAIPWPLTSIEGFTKYELTVGQLFYIKVRVTFYDLNLIKDRDKTEKSHFTAVGEMTRLSSKT